MDKFLEALDKYMELLATTHDYSKLHELDELEWTIRRMGHDLEVAIGKEELNEQLSRIPLTTCRADDAWKYVQ